MIAVLHCCVSYLGAAVQQYIVMKLFNYAGHNVIIEPSEKQVAKEWLLKKGYSMRIAMGTLSTEPVTFIAYFQGDPSHTVAINGATSMMLKPQTTKNKLYKLKITDTGMTSVVLTMTGVL